jgi:F0F1-type ATP synthase alpha subunit
VREWERGFLDYVRAQHPQVGSGIRTTKAVGKDIEAELKTAIANYNQLFGAAK